MKHWFTFIFLSTAIYASGQLRIGLSYYQDAIKFENTYDGFDASDVIKSKDEFVRLSGEVPIGNILQLNGWIDFNSDFAPQSFKIGARKYYESTFYVEGLVKLKQYDLMMDEYMSEGKYLSVWQFGVESGVDLDWQWVRWQLGTQLTAGSRDQNRYQHLSADAKFMNKYGFKTSNFIAGMLKSDIDIRVIQTEKFDLSVFYRFVWRHEEFLFDSTFSSAELIRSSITESVNQRYEQSGNSYQHHFGIAVNFINTAQ